MTTLPHKFFLDRFLLACFDDGHAGTNMLNRLLIEISQGKAPPPTKQEWRTLKAHWQGKLGRRKPGQHRRGDFARRIRPALLALKKKLQSNPATKGAIRKGNYGNLDVYTATLTHEIFEAGLAKGWPQKIYGLTETPSIERFEYLIRPRGKKNPH